MSEEIATAAADLAHVARLQELVNHWRIAAQDASEAMLRVTRERDAARIELAAARRVVKCTRSNPNRLMSEALASYDAVVAELTHGKRLIEPC